MSARLLKPLRQRGEAYLDRRARRWSRRWAVTTVTEIDHERGTVTFNTEIRQRLGDTDGLPHGPVLG